MIYTTQACSYYSQTVGGKQSLITWFENLIPFIKDMLLEYIFVAYPYLERTGQLKLLQ